MSKDDDYAAALQQLEQMHADGKIDDTAYETKKRRLEREAMPPVQRYWKVIVAALGVLVVAAVVANLVNRPAGDDAPTEAEIQAGIVRACESQVEKQLKAPSTAKFSDEQVTKLGAEVGLAYRVTGSVDAENSFGAMIRSSFTCEAERFEGGSMVTKLVSLV